MRLLHVSDLVLGNRNYRREVTQATGVDLLHLDRLAGLEHISRCAIDRGVDVVLVAGGAIDGQHGFVGDHVEALTALAGRIAAAGIELIIYDPTGDLAPLAHVATLLGLGEAIDARGVRFTCIERAASELDAAGARPIVAVGYGSLPGIKGWSSFPPELDAGAVHALMGRASYVALGGLQGACLVQDGACYSGAPALTFVGDESCPGGIIAEIGATTGRLISLTNVQWHGRPRTCVKLDAGRMRVDELAYVLGDHLERICHTIDAARMPSDPDGRLAQVYAPARDINDVPWMLRPLIQVTVLAPAIEFADVETLRPSIGEALDHGEQLLLSLKWEQQPGRFPRRYVAPERRAAPECVS